MQSVIVTYLLSSFSGELENTNISKTISLFQLEYNGACLTGRGYGWTYSPTTPQSQLIDPPHQSSSSGHRWAARGGTHHLSGVCVHVFIIRAILVGAAQRVEARKRLACPSVCRPAWWGAQHPLPGISCFLGTSLVSFQDQRCR